MLSRYSKDILDRAARLLGVADVSDRAARQLGIVSGDLSPVTQLGIRNSLAIGASLANSLLTRDVGFAYGSAYSSTTALAANTPVNIIAAASNANGFLAWMLDFIGVSTGSNVSFLAKATAPATVIDGDVLAILYAAGAGTYRGAQNIGAARVVPAGKRLDIISTVVNSSSFYHALYTLF